MRSFPKSDKLEHVCYDIRGPVHKEALRLEEEGNKILKLNIGNPAPFGFEAPDEILVDVIRNLPSAQGYCDSKGLYSARKAIVQYYQSKGIHDSTVNDVYIGNGVSELITMSMQALLNDGDEVLVPMPDYPLWTAAVTLAGGNAVHYLCDEEAGWFPAIDDIRANDYDLSINKYKEVEREKVTYEPVNDILSRLKANETAYLSGYNALMEMLEEGVNE